MQRYQNRRTGQYQYHSGLIDPSLDGSGWTPWALERLLDLAARLPFEEAAEVAEGFGLAISPSELERLSAHYAARLEAKVQQGLASLADQPLAEGGWEQELG